MEGKEGGREGGREGGLALQQRVHAVDPTQLPQASLVLRVGRQEDGQQLGAVGLKEGKEGRREGEGGGSERGAG